MHTRTVFFVSDGTGITAETFGNAILAQFEFKPRHVRLPFIDSVDKAHQVVRQINHTAELEGRKPIVFTTLVNVEILRVIEDGLQGHAARHVRHLRASAGNRTGHEVQPPHRALLGREQEQGVPRPHRGDQFQPDPRRRPVQSRSRARRRDPGGRQPQRQDADLALPGDAAWLEGSQLSADPGRLRSPAIARRIAAAPQEDLRPQYPSRAAGRDSQRAAPQFALCLARKLPDGSQRSPKR